MFGAKEWSSKIPGEACEEVGGGSIYKISEKDMEMAIY